jgi:hypothetical protein
VIQEQLAAEQSSLHGSNRVAEGNNSLCNQPVVNPDGDAAPNLNDDAVSSNDNEYNPTPKHLPHPPQDSTRRG